MANTDEVIRVGVFGAAGRMGTQVCDAVADDVRLRLVAAVDPHGVGQTRHGVEISADPRAMVEADVDVAVDFTVAAAARTNVQWCALHGVHAVVGTTGFTDADIEGFRSSFGSSNCLIAANFAISAVLMMRFAELAAGFFDTAEIIELHHDSKIDAPSGTAVSTAQRMSAAREARGAGPWSPDPTSHQTLVGARGADHDGIRLHSVRMRGMVAHQEVVFGAAGQTLTIRQDSYDRVSFMPGVVLAITRIASLPGVTVGLDGVLGI